jgi:integration host factor subunit beta
MIRSELAQRLAETHPHLKRLELEKIVAIIFGEVAAALARGDRVELRGFGAFSPRRRETRRGRNPRTGDSVVIPEKHVPYFRGSKRLINRLNPSASTGSC